MAHAAPVPVRPYRRTAATATWPAVLIGVVYGLWVAANQRGGGAITAANVLYGIAAGLIAGVVFYGLHAFAPRLPRERRALAWGAYAGIAFGYLYSLTEASVLRSIGNAALVAGAVACAAFYRYYTTEDAQGHHD